MKVESLFGFYLEKYSDLCVVCALAFFSLFLLLSTVHVRPSLSCPLQFPPCHCNHHSEIISLKAKAFAIKFGSQLLHFHCSLILDLMAYSRPARVTVQKASDANHLPVDLRHQCLLFLRYLGSQETYLSLATQFDISESTAQGCIKLHHGSHRAVFEQGYDQMVKPMSEANDDAAQ